MLEFLLSSTRDETLWFATIDLVGGGGKICAVDREIVALFRFQGRRRRRRRNKSS